MKKNLDRVVLVDVLAPLAPLAPLAAKEAVVVEDDDVDDGVVECVEDAILPLEAFVEVALGS